MTTVLIEHDDRLYLHEDGRHGDEVNLHADEPPGFYFRYSDSFLFLKATDDSPGVQVFQNVCFLLFDVAKKQ